MTKPGILVRMKLSMQLHSPTCGARSRTQVLAFAFTLTITGTLLTACTSRVAQAPSANPRLSEANRQTAASSTGTLVCPTRGSALVQEPASANAGHRVILSWKGSAPPNAKHGAAIGYCIYRGKSEHDPYPQLVNSIPFPGTRCMDDWVENSGKYTYVVRAISFRRVESDPSNVVSVAIPSSKQSSSSASAISAPLCRQPTAASK
jgi:hypothetical protein